MWDHLGRIADILLVIGPIGLWLYRTATRIETSMGLTKQVTNSHLPFVYGRLKAHDESLGLATPEHPPIGLVPNGSK